MTSNSFRYLPLDPQLREIRLLTLSSGCPDEPLQCHLSTTCLTARPIYKALSYVWGDPASSKTPGNTLILDGHPFPVTTNLRSALRHLRPAAGGDSMCLWVDAVCINQGDVDERSQQVAMMRDIYALAAQVIIWLGEEDDGSNAVFDALPVIASRKSRRQYDDEGKDQEYCLDLMRQCGSFFFGLTDCHPWLSRVWILQELAMAKKDPLVVCGWKSVSWSTLVKAWRAIARETLANLGTRQKVREATSREKLESTSIGDNAESHSDGPADEDDDEDDDVEILAKVKIEVLDDLRKAVRSRGGESLRKLLLISRTSAATDPRDRVYGLLGLLEKDALDPGSSVTVAVDYRKPTSEVYTDAMAHIFSRGDGPYFLSGVFLPGVSAVAPHIPSLPPMTKQPDLPSWVPDFSRQVPDKATQPNGIRFHPPATMSASGAGTVCKNGRRLDDNRTLQVEGLLVDTIEQVMSLGTTLDASIENLAYLESVASDARQRPCLFRPSVAPLIQKFKNSEPLWRILISNKHFMSGYDPAPLSYERMYLSLLKQHAITAGGDPNHHNPDRAQRSEYELCLQSGVGQQSFFTTKSGFIGTCVPDSRRGDIIAIVFGSPVPFVLRPITQSGPAARGEGQTYSLVGASYVGGIMGGEMVDELYCEDLMDSTTFFIQ
ncbi:HET-domain-containing protein [Zopfia rhizophila CBS 207.26]|uniref:HET-domain-containing protein n=1 Tax=Zopfia rhizophila CBS 207.26 TaxID=1314779 RepID=A0A6A6EIY5_9PEZI|nr:HET-domain-containing protein [Zopfia rhizophila CBS 207.26]